MYYPIPNGSIEIIENCGHKYECQLPPVGYGKNRITCEVQYVGVRSSSTKKADQVWQPLKLPKDWKERRKKEIKRQEFDSKYYDADLEKIRNQWWLHRLCGEWILINGVHTYIPGTFWMYLNCSPIDIGLPHYRDTDRRLYYIWEYAVEDPRSAGVLDVERRRSGKTFKSGSIILDRTSIYAHHHAGMQSKTGPDAKGIFLKTVVNFFKKYPDFFRPVYDQSKGVTPTSELRFFQTVVKGKKAEQILDGEELESWVDWGSSEIFHYDGTKLNTYVMDEWGKTVECDVWERWGVVRFCLDQDGKWCGKAFCTSTIEDMESGGGAGKKLWDASNPNERDANGRTKSGLYRIFFPSYESTFFDKYGMPETERGRVYYMAQREGLKNDSRALSSITRKNPFTIEEAFRVDGEKCLFNPELLNNRRDELSIMDNVVVRGNFEWKDNIRDSEVIWVKNRNGRWKLCTGFQFDRDEDRNNTIKRGHLFHPGNITRYVSGTDGYDHDTTEDERRSNAASHVLKKHFPGRENDPYANAFVSVYCARPPMSSIYYEDMIKQCFYFGCEILAESNKPGIIKYFKERGYGNFLIVLPGYKDAGVPSTPQNKQVLAELTEEHIEKNINRVYHIEQLDDWLEFDLQKTQKYDLSMSAGWTLVADKHRIIKKEAGKLRDITDFFRKHKVS